MKLQVGVYTYLVFPEQYLRRLMFCSYLPINKIYKMINSNYREEQRMRQWWLWTLLLVIAGGALYTFISQILYGNPVGDHPMPDYGVYLLLIFSYALVFLFLKLKLVTEIDSNGIQMQYIPFLKRSYDWEDIDSTEIVSYGFVGYGIRYSFKYGTVYNTSGNIGLAVNLKNGKRFIIGTQRADEIEALIEKYTK